MRQFKIDLPRSEKNMGKAPSTVLIEQSKLEQMQVDALRLVIEVSIHPSRVAELTSKFWSDYGYKPVEHYSIIVDSLGFCIFNCGDFISEKNKP